jgi:hypothetical protein
LRRREAMARAWHEGEDDCVFFAVEKFQISNRRVRASANGIFQRRC